MSAEISPQAMKKIEELVARYPKKEAALLPVLHIVQEEKGFLSAAEERFVAGLLDIKPIKVREVITFYTMFTQKPLGKYHIQVCSNLSCTLFGGGGLLAYFKEKLEIEAGQTTPDQKFTLTTVECLGACDQAPCMMVNWDLYGNLDKNKINQILESLK